MGAAALHPSMRRLTEPSSAHATAFRRERVLREAGADLVTATSPADSETRMLAGVRTLLAGVPAHAAILHRDGG